ncbi:Alpha/Beta hydrolase protein [Apodospora peruviana]|uniref:Alpha/Beta hydrolase protein n=1 Tax=Apodospora peruviana TaxID=516989 RepID=A0AAE0MFN3_9PEZI|nr:Alpha/Beta hydrolase protein [Apodospora peruviana]
MKLLSTASLLLCSGIITAATAKPSPKSDCSKVSFRLPISVQNTAFSSPPDPNNETEIVDFVTSTFSGNLAPTNGTQLIDETFTINAIYCKPLKHASKKRSAAILQILVHGITYNKDMWSGLGLGEQYNWPAAANAEGYHTLAIDRIGHGFEKNAQYPDPLNVVQGAVHVESVHQLIKAVRSSGRKNVLDTRFDKIIYVGHSYGSFVGTALAGLYPSDVDALVLTGWSTSISTTTGGAIPFRSAALLDPSRFRSRALGYVTVTEESSRETAFFYGRYDRTVAQRDFELEDTTTDGESATILDIASVPPVGYKGRVFVATGTNDALFCEPPAETCASLLEATRQFFPGAVEFGYYMPLETGHCLTLHYTAPETFRGVHEWLRRFF